MRVLIDYHHSDLFESHELLFHDRFGWDVFRPIGMEWFEQGYWEFEKKWHGDAVARQYLDIWETDGDALLSFMVREDKTHPGRIHKMLTLEQARAMKIDLVIATVPDNEAGLYRFAKEIGAHYGVQIGNQWQHTNWSNAEFGLVSSTLDYTPSKPFVTYHQEFRLSDFRYEPPTGFGPVRSFVNCFQETPDYPNFQETARGNHKFTWEVYGSVGSGIADEFTMGNLHSTPLVAEYMRGAGAIWHAKHWSDGYGHVIHNAFASGRPVFGFQRYYKDKLAGPLWEEGVTSFNVEGKPNWWIYDRLEELRNEPEKYVKMCEAARARFMATVDFDEDAEQIQRMLSIVLS